MMIKVDWIPVKTDATKERSFLYICICFIFYLPVLRILTIRVIFYYELLNYSLEGLSSSWISFYTGVFQALQGDNLLQPRVHEK